MVRRGYTEVRDEFLASTFKLAEDHKAANDRIANLEEENARLKQALTEQTDRDISGIFPAESLSRTGAVKALIEDLKAATHYDCIPSRTEAAIDQVIAFLSALEPAAPECEQEAVAEVISFTNGSYHRNYKLAWHRNVPAGTKLYTRPAEQAVTEADVRQAGDILMQYGLNAPEQVIYRAARAVLESFAIKSVTEASTPVPTHECEFHIGQAVHLSSPHPEEDPSTVYFVTGISWEHRAVPFHGWNITIATRDELEKGYGQTDGFAPSDLRHAAEAAMEAGR